jgi:hypothetical protein
VSTYWGYYCRTCDEASEHWLNHGDDVLAEFYNVWQVVKDIGTGLVGLRTDSGWADDAMSVFLEEHVGHNIALHNEYGDVKDLSADGMP